MEANMNILEGAQYRLRVRLTNEAGAQLPPENFRVYGGAFCPGFAPAHFHAERTAEEWVLTMPGLKPGRVPWNWQVIAAEYATGVEWLLAGGEVTVTPRHATGSAAVDPGELNVLATLDKTTLKMTVQLGESTAECGLAVVAARNSAAAAADSAEEAGENRAGAEAAQRAADVAAADAAADAVTARHQAGAAAASAAAAEGSAAQAAASAAGANADAELAGEHATEAAASATAAANSATDAATSSKAAADSASEAVEAKEEATQQAAGAEASAAAAGARATAAEGSATAAAGSEAAAGGSARAAAESATAAAGSATAAANSAAKVADAAMRSGNNTFTGTNTFNGVIAANGGITGLPGPASATAALHQQGGALLAFTQWANTLNLQLTWTKISTSGNVTSEGSVESTAPDVLAVGRANVSYYKWGSYLAYTAVYMPFSIMSMADGGALHIALPLGVGPYGARTMSVLGQPIVNYESIPAGVTTKNKHIHIGEFILRRAGSEYTAIVRGMRTENSTIVGMREYRFNLTGTMIPSANARGITGLLMVRTSGSTVAIFLRTTSIYVVEWFFVGEVNVCSSFYQSQLAPIQVGTEGAKVSYMNSAYIFTGNACADAAQVLQAQAVSTTVTDKTFDDYKTEYPA